MKVLFVRFSSIGDLVLTTPIIRCWKKQHPNDELHFVCKKNFTNILNPNPHLEKVHAFDNFKHILPELKQEKFDLIVDLHKNLRSTRLAFSLRVKRISFDKLSVAKYKSVRKSNVSYLPNIHLVDRYFEGFKDYIINDNKGLDFYGEKKPEFFDKLPTEYNVLVVGAAHNTKKIPLEILKKIQDKSDLPFVILGTKDDNKKEFETLKNCINLCGKSSLYESAFIVKQSETVYTSDTGLMHIASAFKKKIEVFWGNTVPEFGMYPYQTEFTNHQVQLDCRPCSKIGHETCPKGHFNCMMMQEV